MKQTAVEWYAEQAMQLEIQRARSIISISQMLNELSNILEQAKAMEKEQIIECWDNGFANGYDLGKYDDQPNPDDAEQYYNETYESNTRI